MSDTYNLQLNHTRVAQEADRIYTQLAPQDANHDGALTRDELPDLDADTFQRISKEGKVTRQTVLAFVEDQVLADTEAVLKQQLPAGKNIEAEAQNQLNDLVQLMDENHDGKVNFLEYLDHAPEGEGFLESQRKFGQLSAGQQYLNTTGIGNQLKLDNPHFTVHRQPGNLQVNFVVGQIGAQDRTGDARGLFAEWTHTGMRPGRSVPDADDIQDWGVRSGQETLRQFGIDPSFFEVHYQSDFVFQFSNSLPPLEPNKADPSQWMALLRQKFGQS